MEKKLIEKWLKSLVGAYKTMYSLDEFVVNGTVLSHCEHVGVQLTSDTFEKIVEVCGFDVEETSGDKGTVKKFEYDNVDVTTWCKRG